jgi:hypothetical protein
MRIKLPVLPCALEFGPGTQKVSNVNALLEHSMMGKIVLLVIRLPTGITKRKPASDVEKMPTLIKPRKFA